MSAEAVDDTLADLLAEDGIGGDTFFFDETFDLLYALLVYAECVGSQLIATYNVQSLLSSVADMATSDQWDLLTSTKLALVADEQLFRSLLLLSIDLIRDRHDEDVWV